MILIIFNDRKETKVNLWRLTTSAGSKEDQTKSWAASLQPNARRSGRN